MSWEMFIAPAGKYKASGIFSLQHIITLICLLAAISLALFFCRRLKPSTVGILLKCTAIFVTLAEILKITYRCFMGIITLSSFYLAIPLYYCSLFIYASLLGGFAKGHLKTAGLSFMFWSGIIAGTAFLFYPTTSLAKYPLFHFISFHSMIFHGLMVFMGVLVVITGYYKPDTKHFLHLVCFSLPFMTLAFVLGKITGEDIMFLQSTMKFGIFGFIYNNSMALYQIVFFLMQLALPFVGTLLAYKPLLLLKRKPQGKPLPDDKPLPDSP